MAVYFLLMMVVYPLYFKDGYAKIGDVKFSFFRNVTLTMVVLMLIIGTVGFFLNRKRVSDRASYVNPSLTDWFALGYMAAVLLSYLVTEYRSEAVWGAEGWYMGFISQLLFVFIYFFFSRNFKWNGSWPYIILISSGVVFWLGIMNRYSIYPIDMGLEMPTFISTMGNINWFCGYWAVISPVGVMLYWCSRGGWKQWAVGVYIILSFVCGVTQGSSSAYLVFAGIFVLLFYISFGDNKKMRRFLEIVILFCAACQIARVLRYLEGFEFNYEDAFGSVFTDTNLTLYIGLCVTVVYLIFHYIISKYNYRIEQHKGFRNVTLMIIALAALGCVGLIAANSSLDGGIPVISGIPLFEFNEAWANYRGVIWKSGFWAYRHMQPIDKLVGVGPDCFAEYVYSTPELAEKIYSVFGNYRLTNAHNEWITMLVNQGALGLLTYAGMFISAVIRFLKKEQTVLCICAVCIFSYMVHNLVSFQQVLNAPFVFMLMGIGESFSQKQLTIIHTSYKI